ncbi:hypothetical protein [Bacillus massiliigorillae]|uniref:hypothetical protein n=1 Tax=Bacillus massiliigorillae TaxID=1243664 RepID=UPI00039F349F|nr:hypothetical protein [Bacillus massiliigorillae]
MGIYSIVDSRAYNSLNMVVNEFNQSIPKKSFRNQQVELDGQKLGLEKMKASYKTINKWMGRIYIFRWNFSIKDCKPTQDITISLKYSGDILSKRKSKPSFTSNQNDYLSAILNKDEDILSICQKNDFEKLTLSYSKKDNMWTIEVWPNYGDFIWILIPPIRYCRRPNQTEIEMTIQLFKKIGQYISRSEVSNVGMKQ